MKLRTLTKLRSGRPRTRSRDGAAAYPLRQFPAAVLQAGLLTAALTNELQRQPREVRQLTAPGSVTVVKRRRSPSSSAGPELGRSGQIKVGPAGLEPATKGLCYQLRLSPPLSSLWSGLSLLFTSSPYSLYTFPRLARTWLGISISLLT